MVRVLDAAGSGVAVIEVTETGAVTIAGVYAGVVVLSMVIVLLGLVVLACRYSPGFGGKVDRLIGRFLNNEGDQ